MRDVVIAKAEAHAIDDRFPGEEKPILFLADLYPRQMRATVPIQAVMLPRIGAARTVIRPAARGEVLRRIGSV